MNRRHPYRLWSAVVLTLGVVITPSLVGPVFAQELRTVEFESPAVERTMRYNILLPADYDDSRRRYPVLYLLHGGGGNYVDWRVFGAPFYARLYDDLIIVMPDAGNSSYVNWAQSEAGQRNNWEDYIIEDVIGHVDANFRTLPRREARALSGLSMGGYGALTLGLRHPDMFVTIGSTSGSLETGSRAAARLRGETTTPVPPLSPEEQAAREEFNRRPNSVVGVDDFDTQDERTPQGVRFATADDADAHDPFKLVATLPREDLPYIYLDCGTEDRLLGGTIRFAGTLIDLGVPFQFMQLPGGHDGDYWARSLGHIVAVQYEVMKRALGERPLMSLP